MSWTGYMRFPDGSYGPGAEMIRMTERMCDQEVRIRLSEEGLSGVDSLAECRNLLAAHWRSKWDGFGIPPAEHKALS